MPCITPAHDLSASVHEAVLNHILKKLRCERPHLFRVVSKGIEPVILGVENEQEPIKVGDTGHYLDFDIQMEAPADGRKFIDLPPVPKDANPFNFQVQEDQCLLQFQGLFCFQDIGFGEEFSFRVQVGLRCEFVKVEDKWLKLVVKDREDVDIIGLAPLELAQALEYVVLKMSQSALAELSIPANHMVGFVTLEIKGIEARGNDLTARAKAKF